MGDLVDTELRPAIAQSWQRSDVVGLPPDSTLDHLVPVDVDPQSSLLAAASPVLEELDEQLRDTRYGTLLVDRECRVVRRAFDDSRLLDALDDLRIGLGTSLAEEDAGTNALGTAMEIREGIVINGEEHYVELFKRFSCYGQPIRHPLSRRIEGVLDITAICDDANPLLPALVARAVADIERRLLDGSRASERRLLDAFQAASSVRQRAVVAAGEDLVLSNQAALDLLSPTDVAMLRGLAADAPVARAGGSSTLDLVLDSGQHVRVAVTAVSGARRGALLQVEPRDEPSATRAYPRAFVPAPVLVSGPPGSGRTTRARQLVVREPLTVLEATAVVLEGEPTWAQRFEQAVSRRSGTSVVDGQFVVNGTVLVEGIDLLPDVLLDLVLSRARSTDRCQLVLTSAPLSELSGRAAALAGTATRREEMLSLASRREEIPAVAATMLADIEPDQHVRLMPSTIAALAAQAWPGNMHELRAVLEHAVQRRWGDAIGVKDLPDGYRSDVPERPTAPLEAVQRDVIVATLRRCDGNKVKAARELGLSRTTLYARMRALRITTY